MCWDPSAEKWTESSGGCDAVHCTKNGIVQLKKFKPNCGSDGGTPEPTCDPPPGDGAGQGGRRPQRRFAAVRVMAANALGMAIGSRSPVAGETVTPQRSGHPVRLGGVRPAGRRLGAAALDG